MKAPCGVARAILARPSAIALPASSVGDLAQVRRRNADRHLGRAERRGLQGVEQRGVCGHAAVHLPVADDELRSRRGPAGRYHVSTSLPMCRFDSISACARAASAAAKTSWITGLTWPDSSQGQTVCFSAAAIARLERDRTRTQRRAGDRQAPAQHESRVDGRFRSALHRDDHDAAILGETLDVASDVVAGHHVENDVGARAAGQAQHLGDEVLRLVVDRVVGAEGAARRRLLGRADGRDHVRAPAPSPSWIAVTPMPLEPPCTSSVWPRSRCAAVEHVRPDGEEGLGQARRLDVAQLGRARQALADRRDAELGVAAAGDQRTDARRRWRARPPRGPRDRRRRSSPRLRAPGRSEAPGGTG